MKTAMLTTKVNTWLHEHLAIKAPAKLLGGLALGALVMAATALPVGSGLAYADEPARPFSMEQMGDLPGFLQTEVWLPGDTYPMAAYSSKDAKAESEDLPAFLQTEIWLPGDAYPVSVGSRQAARVQGEDLPAFLQTEVWLPGDTYPVFGR